MKRKIVILSVSLVLILMFSFSIVLNSMENIEDVKFSGMVNVNNLNIRQGPGLEYNVVGSLSQGDSVQILGKMNDWYIIQTNNNIIGVCNTQYIDNVEEYKDKNEVLNLINEQRKNAGVKELIMDNKLNEIAQLKAQDMVDNNYFDHTSDKLGTPFEMIANYGVEYKTAGENIAGYIDAKGTVEAWMNSEGHKNNILSNGYNYTGIGIAKSETYGNIYVQLFIGK